MMVSSPEATSFVEQIGFNHTSACIVNTSTISTEKLMSDFTFQCKDLMDVHHSLWEKITIESLLVNFSLVTMTWNPGTTCCQNFHWPYPYIQYFYIHKVVVSTPEHYKQPLADAINRLERDSSKPFSVTLNARNELTDDFNLFSMERTDTAYLEDIMRILGVTGLVITKSSRQDKNRNTVKDRQTIKPSFFYNHKKLYY